MDKTFEYRIYPNVYQQELLQKTFGCCRYVYNKVLAMRQEEYKEGKRSQSINAYMRLLPKWKKGAEPWLINGEGVVASDIIAIWQIICRLQPKEKGRAKVRPFCIPPHRGGIRRAIVTKSSVAAHCFFASLRSRTAILAVLTCKMWERLYKCRFSPAFLAPPSCFREAATAPRKESDGWRHPFKRRSFLR